MSASAACSFSRVRMPAWFLSSATSPSLRFFLFLRLTRLRGFTARSAMLVRCRASVFFPIP